MSTFTRARDELVLNDWLTKTKFRKAIKIARAGLHQLDMDGTISLMEYPSQNDAFIYWRTGFVPQHIIA